MSTGFSSCFNSPAAQNAANYHLKGTVTAVPYNQLASSSGTSFISTSNANVESTVNPLSSLKKEVSTKRTPEELDIIQETAERFKERLTQDQAAVLQADVDSSFVDELDVINRLLPYHIFQQPKDDLMRLISGKGKEKEDCEEICDTKFALDCFKRRQKIVERWRKVLVKSGKRSSPDDQAYYLAQVVLDSDRAENAWLASELRNARSQAERIEREKRTSTSTSRMTQFPSAPQSMMPAVQAQYYRPFPYAYTQAYGSTAVTPTSAPTPTVATFSATPTSVAPTTYSPYLPNGAIPVQLPVASLPALHALGIVPVPAASLPPEGQPQPAAVLRGSTANGTILNLEINVSLLQSAQMTGLAMVLNSLVARTQNVAAATANAATSTNSIPSTSTVAVKHIDSNKSK